MRLVFEGPLRIGRDTITAAWRRRAPDQRIVIRDAWCRGLALVVNPTGMAWRYDYRPRGLDPATGKRWPNKSIQVGRPEQLAPDAARQEATRLKGVVAGGADPAADRRQAVRTATLSRAATLDRLADEYELILPKRPKLRGTGALSAMHLANEMSALRAAIADMDAARTPAADLTIADIRRMLAVHGDQPSAARNRFGALSRFLDWAVDDERIAANPCAKLARAHRPRPPAARAHSLQPAELARLWLAVDTLAPVRRDFVRFLVAVPCRRGEAAKLDWRHLDLAGAVWSQSDKMTKNREPHRFHLHRLALALLADRHQAAGRPRTGLVFPAPGGRGGNRKAAPAAAAQHRISRWTQSGETPAKIARTAKPLSTWRSIKNDADAASGLAGWTFHDMRRSFATCLGESQVPEVVADAILNHRQAATRGGVMGRYQLSVRWPEQQAAMNKWGAILAAAIEEAAASHEGRPVSNSAQRKAVQ